MIKKMKPKARIIALSLAVAFATSQAHADERESLETLRQTTLNLINILVDQHVLTKEKADELIKQAEQSAAKKVAAEKKAEGNVIRVPYVPEVVKNEIRDEIKQEVLAQAQGERWGDPGALPSWMSRISWEGDIRVRFQNDRFDPNNATPNFLQAWYGQSNITNSQENRNRDRLRARLGAKIKVNDWVTGGIRIATGDSSEPVSTNQTLGNTAEKYSIWLDRAYVNLEPRYWASLSGGRIPNPWFSTDLVWDPDINFEGVAATFKPMLNDEHNMFLTIGAFPIQDIAPSPSNKAGSKWLYGAQVGGFIRTENESLYKVGLAVYDYKNVEGIPNPNAYSTAYSATAPQYHQKGNSVFDINQNVPSSSILYGIASKFREINLTASMDLANFDPVHVIVTGDFVKNVGFDQNEILQRTGLNVTPRTTGYQAKLTVGNPKMDFSGNWQASIAYKYLQRDAVLDAFTDSDFHLGGTDAKGYILGGKYALDKNTWLGLRWLSADSIDGPPYAIDVLQMDLNAKF